MNEAGPVRAVVPASETGRAGVDPGDRDIALVTGGSGCIGRAICEALALRGAEVFVAYHRRPEAAGAHVGELRRRGLACQPLHVDITRPSSVDEAFAEMTETAGAPSIVVNNAGIVRLNPLRRIGHDEWTAVIDTNLTGAFNVISGALPAMRRAAYGRIVNVGSVAGMSGSVAMAHYAAAKAGLIGMSRSVAREVAPHGITCNVVAPGFIDSPAIPHRWQAMLTGGIPLRRVGTGAEVAAVVAFIASRAASYLTGVVLNVDGGMGMGN